MHAAFVRESGRALPPGAKIHAAYLTANLSGPAKAILYPAQAPVEKPLTVITAPTAKTSGVQFPGGVLLDAGLYVELQENYEGILIVWD
jgi:hypothetical protein